MSIILLIIFIFILVKFPKLRCVLLHIISVIRYLPVDMYLYIKHKRYNECNTGVIVAIMGLFGMGKTLTAVHIVVNKYLSKNNKIVWCPRRKKFVKQVVKIISNVDLAVPYEKFVSLEQIVKSAEEHIAVDDANNTLTVYLILGDEFSVQMNSRNFKSNINPLLLNTILTCRHHNIALYYTSQRFQHVDALLRQVTSYCIDCNKTWRLQGINYYDAWEMENATSPRLVTSYKRSCWFVKNRDYNMYDTLACVDNLKKSWSDGDMLSEDEILQLQCNNTDIKQISKPTKKLKKLWKKAS